MASANRRRRGPVVSRCRRDAELVAAFREARRGGDEATHDGSCEALRASSGFDVPVLVPTAFVLPVISDSAIALARATLSPAPASSPPLFLLYAALLI